MGRGVGEVKGPYGWDVMITRRGPARETFQILRRSSRGSLGKREGRVRSWFLSPGL